MDTIGWQLLLQVILILINAFFAATEIAVLSLNGAKLRKLEEEGDKSAPRLLKLVEEPSGFLSTIQVGITLAGFLGSAFAADNFSEYLVSWIYDGLGFRVLSLKTLDTLAVVIITIILSFFTLVFGELVPKRIAMQKSMQLAKIAAPVVSAVAVVMKPVVWLLSVSTNGILKLLRLKTEAEEETVTEDEIRMMVELGSEKGTIDEEEQEWIQNVFDFGDTSVRDVMTHESDIVAIPMDASDDEIRRVIQESGLSRFPVYEKDIHGIQGILSARAFLLDRDTGHPRPLKELLRPAYFVPETIHTDQLFRDMQKKKIHLAVVADEYGDTAGLVTMEDLLEEIVGNIYDEFDPAEEQEIVRLEDNLWRVAGSTRIDTLAEELEMDLPEDGDYDTLAGMVYSCLHTIPRDGAQLDVEVSGLQIHVDRMEGRRIVSALVKKLPQSGEQ
ncbi:MAG: hemolysin family protein [Oscillospiraceae bacterium]|nr:hemolysin family protein [Oscillospiraceae bacterium]